MKLLRIILALCCAIPAFAQKEALQRAVGTNTVTGSLTSAPFQVETIAALKAVAVTSSATPNGIQCYVNGYYANGDGGQGYFKYAASSVLSDNGGTIVQPIVGSGRWLRLYTGEINVLWFGPKHDGVTDDSAVIQAAINAVGTGTVRFPNSGTYLIHDVSVPSYVTLSGEAVGWDYHYAGGTQRTLIKLGSHGSSCFQSTSTTGIGFSYLNFVGYGDASTLDVGLLLTNVSRATVDSCSFYKFAGETIRETGYANRYTNLLCFGGNWTAPSRNIGAVDIGSTDSYMENIEASSGQSNDQVNLYRSAIIIRGGATMLVNVIGELSDQGFLITGQGNMFTNCRADLNYGHGFWIKRIDVGLQVPQQNRFINSWALRCGRYAANTYSGFAITESLSAENQFSNCYAQTDGAIGDSHRFGFYDGGQEHYDASGAGLGNIFSNCLSSGQATQWLGGRNINTGAALVPSPAAVIITDGGTTPNVEMASVIKLNYTAPTNITNFTKGVPGQDLYVMSNNGNITLVNSSVLVTNTGANKTLVSGQLYHFKNVWTNWQEIKND